jgi:cell wall-associated NlpC family hydrolase
MDAETAAGGALAVPAPPHALSDAVCLAFAAALALPRAERGAVRQPPLPPPVPARTSLRPVEALATRHVPDGPRLPGLLPAPRVPTFLSAQAYPAAPARPPATVTYLYAALPEPRANARMPRPRRTESRVRAALAPAAVGARRLAVVGAVAVLALTVPFGRIVSYVEAQRDALVGTPRRVDALPAAPLVPGLRLAAAEAPLTAAPLAQPQRVSTVGGGALTPIPAAVFVAYSAGAVWANAADPGCHLSWSVLAGIGEVESGHAVSGGALRPGWNGTASPPILGPLLDGTSAGASRVPDTDGGLLDGDTAVDRAVGPMQFLPSSWAVYGVDANGDGRADPQNVGDAAAAAGLYLCAGGADLSDPSQAVAAAFRYNHADAYVRAVLSAASGYLAASYGPGPQGVALSAIAFGYAHLGDPYLWGGNGPLYDCSGLTQAAYLSAGIRLPRTAEQQWQQLPHVSETDLQPGDLVFFNAGEFVAGLPGHVGIYLGSGLMLDDPHTGAFVRIEPVQGFGTWVGAARPSLLATYPGAPLPGTGFVVPPATPTLGPPTPLAPAPVPVVTVPPAPRPTPTRSTTPPPVPTLAPPPTLDPPTPELIAPPLPPATPSLAPPPAPGPHRS